METEDLLKGITKEWKWRPRTRCLKCGNIWFAKMYAHIERSLYWV